MEITPRYDRTTRVVRLEITGATEPMSCGTSRQPRRFLPEVMELEWQQGKLEYVRVNGHRLLKDETKSLSLDGLTIWAGAPNFQEDQLPTWIREEIDRYTEMTVPA